MHLAKQFSVIAAILVVFASTAPAQSFCDDCVGVMCAFSCTGPNRPPALEDQPPPFGFSQVFGDRPPPFGTGGGRINLTRDLAPVVEWRRARREFKSLASDFEMELELAVSIAEHTGGVPIAWESNSGKTFLAVVDSDKELYRVPVSVLNLKDAVLVLVSNIVSRGGCVPKVPGGNGADVTRRDNDENCGRSLDSDSTNRFRKNTIGARQPDYGEETGVPWYNAVYNHVKVRFHGSTVGHR